MRRIFIAVKVDAGENLKSMISTFKSSLKGENIKWVKPENIHVTLAFLGDTEEDKIKIVCSLLQMNCTGFGESGFLLKGMGVYKNLREPRVIWAGIQLADNLGRLYNVITTGLKKEGFNVEERPFSPHLTIGRIKSLRPQTNLKILLEKYQDVEIQKVLLNEVILYESILKPTGPIYKPISIIKLTH